MDSIDEIATETTRRVLDMDWDDAEAVKAVIAGAILKAVERRDTALHNIINLDTSSGKRGPFGEIAAAVLAHEG